MLFATIYHQYNNASIKSQMAETSLVPTVTVRAGGSGAPDPVLAELRDRSGRGRVKALAARLDSTLPLGSAPPPTRSRSRPPHSPRRSP